MTPPRKPPTRAGVSVVPSVLRTPSVVYDPPQAPPPPPVQSLSAGRFGADYEADSIPVQFQATRNASVSLSREISVVRTRSRKRAIDVFVDASGINNPTTNLCNAEALVRVNVYAISTGGGRVLVASGILDALQFTTAAAGRSFPLGPVYVCAARAQAESFEITVQYLDVVAAAPGTVVSGTLRVSYVATDEANEPPAGIGLGVHRNQWFNGNFFVPGIVLDSFIAINQAAADRYVLLIEGTGNIPAGAIALMQWSLPAGLGQMIQVPNIGAYAGTQSFALLASTTPNVLAGTADVIIQGRFR